MELMNQLLFGIFGLILFGIFLTVQVDNQLHNSLESFLFWRYTVLLRSIAYFFWFLVPFFGSVCLLPANYLYIASVVLLALFLSSWNAPIKRSVMYILAIGYVIFCFVFLHFFLKENSFVARVNTVAGTQIPLMIWELFSIAYYLRKKRDYVVGVLIFFLALQVTAYSFRIITVNRSPHLNIQNIVNADLLSSMMSWTSNGINVIVYILINAYLYRRLWKKERESTYKYDIASKERTRIQELLVEREKLVSYLLKSNKTASTGALAASLAHELSQPLGASLLNAQHLKSLMDRNVVKLDLEKDIVNSIEADTRRAGQIIRSLRALFSGDAITLERIDLIGLVYSIAQLVEPECRGSNIELLIEMPERCYINANSNDIHQAILNVLNNAIQSLKSKNNIEKKHILIAINLQGEQVTINISDNGPGVPIEREHSLFELLDSQKESGMGLGLWLCKYIMTRRGGDIFYKRGSNGGATFSLVFPPPIPVDDLRI